MLTEITIARFYRNLIESYRLSPTSSAGMLNAILWRVAGQESQKNHSNSTNDSMACPEGGEI